MAGRTTAPLTLRDGDHATLLTMAHERDSPAAARRASIVLLAAEGVPNVEIAARVGTSRPTVNLWRQRYGLLGVPGLASEPHTETSVDQREILLATLQKTPEASQQKQWSSRSLAGSLGVSHVTVTRAWREYGIRPTGADTYTFATDPPLAASIMDVIGLYVAPIECAVMLRAEPRNDEAATAAVTTRVWHAAPAVPITSLRTALRMTPDHIPPWRTQESEGGTLLNFLDVLHRNHPEAEMILVLDNAATADRIMVQRWLTGHPRVHVVAARNLTMWLNLLDVWLTQVTIRSRAEPAEAVELIDMIRPLATSTLARPPFVWTKPTGPAARRPTAQQTTAGQAQQGSQRRPSATGTGNRGFPFVAQAGHTQFAPDRVITYPRVQSRAVVGCHAGIGHVILNGKEHPLRPGLLYLLPWDHSIVYRPDPRDPFFVFGVHVIPWQSADQPIRFKAAHNDREQFFNVDWRLPYSPGDAEPTREVVVTSEAERPGLAALTRYTIERFLRGLPSPAEGRALGVLAMSELNATSTIRPQEDPTLPADLRGLLVWITRDLARNVTLSDMASVMECSPSTVTRSFRRFLGCAPMNWVIDQRIELAQHLLAAGNPTIASVARSCGYHDAEYFSRLFKDRVGSTPREWRRYRTI